MISSIQFICPHIDTGGPENIHQVCSCLNRHGYNASILYVPKMQNATHLPKFQTYNNPIAEQLLIENNLLVIPEYLPMASFYNIDAQKAMFWLSVDNSIDFKAGRNLKAEAEKGKITWHFVQSEYAKQVLEAYGITNIIYLSDCINSLYFEKPFSTNIKKPQVLFNPKKGIDFTCHLIHTNPSLKFIPIQNMTVDQVINLMDESMVYIDFGNHPGKDRFPREAALRNCIIITNMNGAAGNNIDVPILDKYKIPHNYANLKTISNLLNDVIENYNTEITNFNAYRSFILDERESFDKMVLNAFKSIINN